MPRLAALVVCLVTAAVAAGDVVTLRDGSTIEGSLQRIDNGYLITTADGEEVEVHDRQIAGIRRGEARPGTDAARDLAAIRRSVRHLGDLTEIVDRYEAFIALHPDTDEAADAEADLAVWQTRLDEGQVRYRGAWVTPDEQRRLAAAALEEVNTIRLLIKDGRVDEARRRLRAILRSAPDDVSALYLLGVIEQRSGNVLGARERFEQVADLEPTHAPTANNLAVVLLRQNQLGRAVMFMDNALRDAPGTKGLLDNAAELLHLVAVADDPRVSDELIASLRTRFATQDARLAERLAEQGWYRWGAAWVDADTWEQVQAVTLAADREVAALEEIYEAKQRDLRRIEQDIISGRELMKDLEDDRLYVDAGGFLRRRPLPASYYDVQARVAELEAIGRQVADELPRLEAEARRVRSELPDPPFEGRLELIGEDGVPVVVPVPAE